MTQEEKAKRYDEALERARKLQENSILKKWLWNIFPELKENEDERIRKAILSGLKYLETELGWDAVGDIDILDAYAWLKKQGEVKETLCEKCKKAQPSHSCQDITALGRCAVEHEQKTADEVEPKFHEGEWITNGDYIWKIVEVKPLDYILQSQYGNIVVDDTIFHVDEHFHSFTIEDAKEGDVLTYKNDKIEWILIYKNIITESCDVPHDVLKYHALFTGTVFYNSGSAGMISENYALCFTPATKEQRDTLERVISNAGYRWNKEKLKLEKI